MRSLVTRNPVLFVRVVLALALGTLGTLFIDGFASGASIASMTENIGLIGLIATGLMLTMIIGELDMSVASVAAFCSVLGVLLSAVSLPLAIVVPLSIAAMYGAGLGWLISKTGINSLVLTICALIAVRGAAMQMVPNRPALLPFDLYDLSDFMVSRVGGVLPVTYLGLICFVIILMVGLFLKWTRLGLAFYALGASEEGTKASGINVTHIRMLAFMGAAVLAGIAGILAALRSGSASGTGMESFLLAGVTAAVVGGIRLEGGAGWIGHVLLGSLIIRLIVSGIALLALPNTVELFVIGLTLLVMLAIDGVVRSAPERLKAHPNEAARADTPQASSL